MKRAILIATVAGATMLTGCVATQPVVKKSSLEIQASQAKMFDTDKKTAFKSVLSVLQDLGYIVQAANLDTGVITAQSPIKGDNSFIALALGTRVERRTYVTASIEDFNAKQTRVRLNFVERLFVNSSGQQMTDEKPIYEAQIYVNAFEKIGEAIFIREAQN